MSEPGNYVELYGQAFEQLKKVDILGASHKKELESAVVEAAITYFESQREWTKNGKVGPWADEYDTLWSAVDALLKAREPGVVPADDPG